MADRTAHRDRRGRGAALSRRVRDLRPRQRHLPLRGAGGGEGGAADLARPERAVDGPGGRRLCQGQKAQADHGGDELDRAGCHEHGDRRRCRAHQPAAAPPAVGRRVRQPGARSRPAAGRALQQPDLERQRCLQGGHTLLGPHHAARADHPILAASPGDDARPCGLRPGVPGLVPGRARRGLRLPGRGSSSRARTRSPGPGPTTGNSDMPSSS